MWPFLVAGAVIIGGGICGRRGEGREPGAARRPAAYVVVLGASAAAWALAYPQAAPAATVVRALADCAAAVTLGLAVVPMLDAGRYRDELTRRASGPLALAAGFWLFAELSRLVVGAAEAAAIPVTRVGLSHDGGVRDRHVCRAVRPVQRRGRRRWCLVVALVAARTPPAAVAAAGIAAVGLVARTIGGHMSASALGAVAIAIHVAGRRACGAGRWRRWR